MRTGRRAERRALREMNRRPEIGAVKLFIGGRGRAPGRVDHEVGRDLANGLAQLIRIVQVGRDESLLGPIRRPTATQHDAACSPMRGPVHAVLEVPRTCRPTKPVAPVISQTAMPRSG